MEDLQPLNCFLGVQDSRDSTGLRLRQSKYVSDILDRAKMIGAKQAAAPCDYGSKLSKTHGDLLLDPTEYRQIVDALQYCTLKAWHSLLCRQTLSTYACANLFHWIATKRVLRYLKGTVDFGLFYAPSSLSLQAFCDSDWIATSGIFLGQNLISWSAKKQNVVSRSST